MVIAARISELNEIAPLRELYRGEMDCQIIHDSIHVRPGWTREYALELDDALVGYGSVAIAGPWRENPALYEFYVQPEYRGRIFDLFEGLLAICGAMMIETQTNDRMLTPMLHTFASNIIAEKILFEDSFRTSYAPEGAGFGAAMPDEADATPKWLVTFEGEIAGTGGVLYHYNRPYGDIYMEIFEPFRRKGLGAYLVQELKAVCRAEGTVPAARCNVGNLPSRKTLQKAGFVPCGNLITGDLLR